MGLEAARELDCAALGALLREPWEAERTLVLDCRPFLAFCRRHVRAARPVPWNALLISYMSSMSICWVDDICCLNE